MNEFQKEGGECMVIDDGKFGHIKRGASSFVFWDGVVAPIAGPGRFPTKPSSNARLVVIGDAVAAGHGAWLFQGWAWSLASKLREKYGYGYINLAKAGATMEQLADSFEDKVRPCKPLVVVIGCNLEVQKLKEGSEQEKRQFCRKFANDLENVAHSVWQAGALPVIASLHPHDEFGKDETKWLYDLNLMIKRVGAPVVDCLDRIVGGGEKRGTWTSELADSPDLPNTKGHQAICEAFDLSMFEPHAVTTRIHQWFGAQVQEQVCFSDGNGFEVLFSAPQQAIKVHNDTTNNYALTPTWGALQESLWAAKHKVGKALRSGFYLALENQNQDMKSKERFIMMGEGACLEKHVDVPAGTYVVYHHVSHLMKNTKGSKVIFDDGNLKVVLRGRGFWVINQTESEYSIHPMWRDLRLATRLIPQGVYNDSSDQPFRTALITVHGLQSRVKIPASSALLFSHVAPLTSLERVALLPLGDRCSIRMLLHKIEYDGPCYPFDLTRTTSLADVSDIIGSGFKDMWNGDLLCYDHDRGRIFHKKWGGLSYAHEHDEEGDNPIENFDAIVKRMGKRYGGRAARFDYACKKADRVLFLRTGCATRGEVVDCLKRIGERFPGLNGSLMLISDQEPKEFEGIMGIVHVREHFDPDRMYEDKAYWLDCALKFRHILKNVGIDERTLYWCPNNLEEAEIEEKEHDQDEPSVMPVSPKEEGSQRSLSHTFLLSLDPSNARSGPSSTTTSV
jgi:hypothetical protein